MGVGAGAVVTIRTKASKSEREVEQLVEGAESDEPDESDDGDGEDKGEAKGKKAVSVESEDDDESPTTSTAAPAPTRQSSRVRTPSEAAKRSIEYTGTGKEGAGLRIHFNPETASRSEAGEQAMLAYAFSVKRPPNDEPRTVPRARQRDDWKAWEAAIKKELARFHEMDTWALVGRRPT